MATEKTKLTEVGTAVGLMYDPGQAWPAGLAEVVVPGIPTEVWQPIVLPATEVGSPHKDLLLHALANGHAFRTKVLGGRLPDRIEWTGAARSVWTSDVPRDLTVEGVWFIQAKYDSHCVLNTSPGAVVDDLLVDHAIGTRTSWFEEVAADALQDYYAQVRARTAEPLPDDVRDLGRDHRAVIKPLLKAERHASDREAEAYLELARTASVETARRWQRQINAATLPQRTQMLFRMLRIAGGPYWLLGTKGKNPVQLRVTDTRTWRERFELKRFTAVDAHAGQPQVNWRAEVHDRSTADRRTVEGYCEIRWSHGKLQGNPECKVQVTTPLEQIPGYDHI
jgi:hypothetical protein